MNCNTTFTIDQERKYAQRYEEGYDLPDTEYDAWLKINHPDHNYSARYKWLCHSYIL